MQLILTLLGIAGYLVAVSSWIEYLLKNPSDFWKSLHYFNTVRKDREAFAACILCVPIMLIVSAALIIFFPGAVAAIVGFLLALTKPILWIVESRSSLFTEETLKRADALFDGADANKDGVLTFKEIKAYAKANPWFSDAYKSLFGATLEEALRALFTGADANQDGVLTRKELHDYLVRQMNRIRLVKVLTVAAICCLPLIFLLSSRLSTLSPLPVFGKEIPPPTATKNGKAGTGVSRRRMSVAALCFLAR